jgi:hypothetical protein
MMELEGVTGTDSDGYQNGFDRKTKKIVVVSWIDTITLWFDVENNDIQHVAQMEYKQKNNGTQVCRPQACVPFFLAFERIS